MVQATKLLLLANASSGTVIPKAAYSPKGLYKYLIRQCQKLPHEEISAYYKHHVRQSFNQHADESDPERVDQIINQAVKDIDWVLKKVTFYILSTIHHRNSEVKVLTPFKFFHALSTLTSRPELVIPHVRSTDIEWSSIDPEITKCYNNHNTSNVFDYLYSAIYHNGKCEPSMHVAEFSGSLQEETINSWLLPNSEIKRVELKRFIHHRPNKESKLGWSSKVLERWDFDNGTVEILPILGQSQKPLPQAPFVTLIAKYSSNDKLASITVTPYLGPLETETDETFQIFKRSVVPKVLEWMSNAYVVDPPKLSRLRARPHSFVSNSIYWLFYDLIKSEPAEKVKSIWKESTDPVKFIHEDIGIASYIASFIYGETSLYRPNSNKDIVKILDLGCGNGLLCFFLSQILSLYSKDVNVVGFDIRKRRLWEDLQGLDSRQEMKDLLQSTMTLPKPLPDSKDNKVEFTLTERAFLPHVMDDLIQDFGMAKEDSPQQSLWIIGNHSDELTPWIPVVSRRLKASGFFIIPCCPFDFYQKYQRRGDVPGSSLYYNYIEYTCTIGDKYGYQPTLEKLRIPSTKNICLVGLDCSRRFEEGILSARVEDVISQLNSGDQGNPLSKFVPRTVESAMENPVLEPRVAIAIVEKIFGLLVKPWNETVHGDEWYTGREDLTFAEITNALSIEEREMLKGKGRGLRTLVKSNRHLLMMNGNIIKLRMPDANDIGNVRTSSRDKIKSRDCYFKTNHPQGCPLPDNLCSYRH
ncbi:putative tRNA (uracil-O(2)-)-methyltransferase [Orchesella cincta]|uniref:tRNA (uracil-O(2)-)-methyltransferase n=1 Tax=Orchesella cincta TaxID=48709 RepID=A0A1D2N909_ORCCI|nr:putative tRNA (uracil-O(2)-)-methyltransferase [Orchesella cincta]